MPVSFFIYVSNFYLCIMGTNYYRIPTSEEMNERKERLKARVIGLKMEPEMIERGFNYIESEEAWSYHNPWSEFLDGTSVHLGKRSSGWKFVWDFNKNRYYSNKKELLDFIRSGRVVNEYGEELEPDEFIEMALSWGEPNGLVVDREYLLNNERYNFLDLEKNVDLDIDGLRVSQSTNFS